YSCQTTPLPATTPQNPVKPPAQKGEQNFTPTRSKPILDSSHATFFDEARTTCGSGDCCYWQCRPRSLSLPGASAGSAPDLLGQLPADAPIISYIDVAALRGLQNSPLAAVLGLTSAGPHAHRAESE